MFCKNCGTQIPVGVNVCPNCNLLQNEATQPNPPVYYQQPPAPKTNSVPKCTCCGYVGEMKPGPLLTGSDWLWFLLLLCAFGAGFIFLIFKIITRANPKKREKICPHCGSVNMFTYLY